MTCKGTRAEVREIHPGEEFFTSYIDLLYPTEDMNDWLRDFFFFYACKSKDVPTKTRIRPRWKSGGSPIPQRQRHDQICLQCIELWKTKHYTSSPVSCWRSANSARRRAACLRTVTCTGCTWCAKHLPVHAKLGGSPTIQTENHPALQ